MKAFARSLLWIVPSGLSLAVMLAFLDGRPDWLTGWLAYSAVLIPGLLALTAAWRWACDEPRPERRRRESQSTGSGRALAWIVMLAFVLRLGAGLALYLLLPVAGYDSPTQQEGYVFYDAFRRDHQAWDLASSGQPLWMAFSKSYSTDQYGGLLALSAFIYRYLSPSVHRPLLIVALAGVIAALGVPFLWRAARQIWGEKVSLAAAWIFALYPESILQGSSQMREPFLMTFVVMAFCGLIAWQALRARQAWLWLGLGLAGMLLVSPGVALVTLVVLGGWLWFGGEHRRISWYAVLVAAIVFFVALSLFAWGASRQVSLDISSPLAIVLNWFRDAVKWNRYILTSTSGYVDGILDQLDPRLHLFFVTGYGIAQPVLPAALIDPAVTLWRVISSVRAAGWYALAPLLIYSLSAAWKTPDARERRLLLWLGMAAWIWILLSALRAGGDQWDNPRYRVILLGWQAILAGYAWVWWREQRTPWLPRIWMAEGIAVAFFTQWYLSRYYKLFGRLYFWPMVAWIVGLSALIFIGGWLWDRWRQGRGRRA